MSIKIYNGQEVVGLSLSELLQELIRLRPVFTQAAFRQASVFLARHACASFDRVSLSLPRESSEGEPSPYGASHLFLALEALERRQKEVLRTQRRDSDVDFAAQLSVHVVDERILVLPFIENPVLAKLWDSQPWVKPLPYWDNADRPKKMLVREWKARAALWNKALDGFGPPVATGFSFELSPALTPVVLDPEDLAEVLNNLPTLEQRASAQALNALVARAAPGTLQKVSDVVRLRQSPAFEEECARLRDVLVPQLFGEQLWQSVPYPTEEPVQG